MSNNNQFTRLQIEKKLYKSDDIYKLNVNFDVMLQKKSLFLKKIFNQYIQLCQKIKRKN